MESTHVWTRTNHVNFIKIGSKLRSVSRHYIISCKSRSVIFNVNWRTSTRFCCLKDILIRKKILWRINFSFTKFLQNALLFGKSWNECKNTSLLHKVMCTESDHSSTKMRHCLSTFMALYSRRFCLLANMAGESLNNSFNNLANIRSTIYLIIYLGFDSRAPVGSLELYW